MTVREKLKRLRNDLGLSQERFGEALNLNKYPSTAISEYPRM